MTQDNAYVDSTTPPSPSVTALICTRDRGDTVLMAVRTILRNRDAVQEVIVIDQSKDNATELALEPYRSAIRYVRMNEDGKGNALNLGMAMATGDIVAITDDDCEVSEIWPRCLVSALAAHPQAIIAYGNVNAPEYDKGTGWIPVYEIKRSAVFKTMSEKRFARGIGANTAVRRCEAQAIGGFDNETGPGGKFRACIDGDMTYRCLLHGYWALEVAESNVLHFGFRPNKAASKLVRNAFYGIGAAHVKPIKCGHTAAIPVLLREFFRHAFFPAFGRLLTFQRPTGLGRMTSFCRGVRDGWNTPLDKRTVKYIVPPVPKPRET